MKKSSGFTLIELIIVILILGVLGAYAAPKFMGLDIEARKKVMQSLESSVKMSSEMVHSMAIVQGKDVGHETVVTSEGDKINTNNGYAVAAETSLMDSAGKAIAGLFSRTSGDIQVGGIGVAVNFDEKQIRFTCSSNVCKWEANIPDASKCYVSYTYDGTRVPDIASNFDDCHGRVKK